MNTRITQLPNGKWIAEIEESTDAWYAVSPRVDEFRSTVRGNTGFPEAQQPDRQAAVGLLRQHLSDFYGEVLPEETTKESMEREVMRQVVGMVEEDLKPSGITPPPFRTAQEAKAAYPPQP